MLFLRSNSSSRPLPSGSVEVSNPFNIEDFIEKIGGFFALHSAQILAGVIIVLFVAIIIERFRRHRAQVEKLWSFVLFFLSKRQMMIPLVIKLGQRNQALTEGQVKTLLDFRQQCDQCSLRTSPTQRLALEKDVSAILFDCFKTLEIQGELDAQPKLKKIVTDLEFIDKKLVELQVVYNLQAAKWNQKVKPFFWLNQYFKPFKSLELFTLPQ